MSKKILTTPIKEEDVKDLKIGDIVYLTGTLVTARDCVHTRVVKHGRKLPVNIRDRAIFHGGPIMTQDPTSPSGWRVVAIGPTTSMRMELFEKEFIDETGVRLIIGKGGMGPNTEAGCKAHKAIHCIFPAGCAVIGAEHVEVVEDVKWPELGMPESLWCMKVKEFGPLIVSIDTEGRNLIAQNKALFNEKKGGIVKDILPKIGYTD